MVEKIPFIRENYIGKMEELSSFRQEYYEEGDFPGCDFRKIHFYQMVHPKEKAAIVISHGFCEFVHKYDELIYYFYNQGYSVYFIDHRGHGKSYRSVEDMDKVDLVHFYDCVDDLKCFMECVVNPTSPKVPKFMYCHSMGGAIGAAVLEEYPKLFQAAVLSSPMMEMNLRGFHLWFVRCLSGVKCFFGKGQKYAPGNKGFDGVNVFETSGALDRDRYDYFFAYRLKYPEFRTYGGSYHWLYTSLKAQSKIIKRAAQIQVPVLLCQAGLDTTVNPGGQNKFAERNTNIVLVRYPNSKHEIYNAKQEDREAYVTQVMEFFDNNLKK